MPQSYGPVYLHIVFGTKHREAVLTSQLHTDFARYITPILHDCKTRLIAEGGMPDHVHLLIDLGRESSVSKSPVALNAIIRGFSNAIVSTVKCSL